MTPEALTSWTAFARYLSTNSLHALLRGLRGNDERVACCPIYYALICGEAMSPPDALIHAAKIEMQAVATIPSTHFGFPGGLNQILDWRCWWHDPDEAIGRYAALAGEVAWELERRGRVGQARVTL